MDQVAAALDVAKWKELVTLETQRQGDETNSALQAQQPPVVVHLTASLDTINGGLQWNPVTTEDGIVQSHLQAKQWILPMLNDDRRNQMYYEAIQQVIAQQMMDAAILASDKQKDDNGDDDHKNIRDQSILHVLDLGCGTGLLGMMAAKLYLHLRISSVDMSSVMVHLAKQTIGKHPDLSSRITVREGHSTQMSPFCANICVSELLEDGLLGEGWLPAIRDVWKRHMVKSITGDSDQKTKTSAHIQPVVIPCGASVVAQLIQGEWLADYVGPRPFVAQNGTILYPTGQSPQKATQEEDIRNWVHGRAVVPMHVGPLLIQGKLITMSDPVTILEFDVSQSDRVPGPEGRMAYRTVTASKEGTVHAILVWWNLSLTPNIIYSLHDPSHEATTASSSFQDHWHPCVHVLESPVQVQSDEGMTLRVRHDDYSIKVSLEKSRSTANDTAQSFRSKREKCSPRASIPAVLSPGRIFQLNQTSRLKALEHAISAVFQQEDCPSLVLDVSDHCIAALLATTATSANGKVSKLFTLERIEAQAAVDAIQSNSLQRSVQIWQGHFEQVTKEALATEIDTSTTGQKHILVVGEPAYAQLHYWPHLEVLQFYFVRKGLHDRLGEEWKIQTVPQRARLWATAFESAELAKAYGPCDALQEKYGLDHAYVTQQHYGAANKRELSLSLWQYNFTYLTDPFEVGLLPFDGTVSVPRSARLPFVKKGTCHGIVVWVETEYTPTHILSTSPSILGTRQLVYLWKNGIAIDEVGSVQLLGKTALDPTEPSGLAFDFTIEIEK